jgi:hypothetical protein
MRETDSQENEKLNEMGMKLNKRRNRMMMGMTGE